MPLRQHAELRARVAERWRQLGYARDTAEGYLQWVDRYRSWCRVHDYDDVEQLTRRSVDRFSRSYASTRGIVVRSTVLGARPAIHTWARTLTAFGFDVPAWVPPRVGPFDEILAPYREFRRRWRGLAESSLGPECDAAIRFMKWMRRHRQHLTLLRCRASTVPSW